MRELATDGFVGVHAGAVAAAREADEVDFVALIDRLETPLLRYAAHLLGDADDAQDAVQEAFLRLHKQIRRHGESSVENTKSWLFRVTHNLAMDMGRKRTRKQEATRKALADAQADPDVTVESTDRLGDLERREACDRAMAELRDLPDQQKQVLLLKVIGDMSLRQISKVTGMSVSNASYRMNQGLRELSRRLKLANVI